VNEQLVKGREDVYSGFRFAEAEKRLPGYAVKHYVDTLASDPAALRGSSRPTARWMQPSRRTSGVDRPGTLGGSDSSASTFPAVNRVEPAEGFPEEDSDGFGP